MYEILTRSRWTNEDSDSILVVQKKCCIGCIFLGLV